MQAEVNYLGLLYHENLVNLIGYCAELDNRLLVYEVMSKGSLENHLFKSESSNLFTFVYVCLIITLTINLFCEQREIRLYLGLHECVLQ